MLIDFFFYLKTNKSFASSLISRTYCTTKVGLLAPVPLLLFPLPLPTTTTFLHPPPIVQYSLV